jgi:hypothetical protein
LYFIKSEITAVDQQDPRKNPASISTTVLQKYSILASKIVSEVTVQSEGQPDKALSSPCDLWKYLEEVKERMFTESPLQFWMERMAVYPKLCTGALDLVSALASQAFVERIFSLWTTVIRLEKPNQHLS